ncbi:5'-methylthioadenosine/S-adenosylhomocysteine nucleosidase [Limimaricola hongkongensis]|uniref:5'-methylthioadenosine nucleosidase / S-adenosylhomocysteine nucleosidase n=1 Tax=Limimaricola hongkongensis DSM 17492 TaxID=1122180 RepID=A0A017HDZ5_9RHOB|nr:5'-methylthioadenosine/S-adenosylhomocysteine nucleosidase [Limimaricola hongkongensis]EYD72388.1 5'-methylthioadenosine nucleosidase / S-adenosylhomocysteine nucleosidase [Limimaricola hongkongensis DSM 17492]
MTQFPLGADAIAQAQPLTSAPPDRLPRIAVISAFAPEIALLEAALEAPETRRIGPATYLTGRLEGREVVLFLSGISMVNAAMTTQAALDHFNVTAILFSGIAGGVDPSLGIGDVVVAERWAHYLEGAFARETAQGYALPGWMGAPVANYGMIHTRGVDVVPPGGHAPESRFWFDSDPALMEIAQAAAQGVVLEQVGETAPQVVIGGNGVSGPVFMDNAGFRDHAFEMFEARVLDMESASVAQVAYANAVPFIAFRSLSDLAGGGDGENEIAAFLSVAATNSARLMRAVLARVPQG